MISPPRKRLPGSATHPRLRWCEVAGSRWCLPEVSVLVGRTQRTRCCLTLACKSTVLLLLANPHVLFHPRKSSDVSISPATPTPSTTLMPANLNQFAGHVEIFSETVRSMQSYRGGRIWDQDSLHVDTQFPVVLWAPLNLFPPHKVQGLPWWLSR